MKKHQIIASVFIAVSLILGVILFSRIEFPIGLEGYFKSEYYQQFGPLSICVELLIAGIYLFVTHRNANFALALFAFTTLFDFLLNLSGIFDNATPVFATVIFLGCSAVALWLAFFDVFELGTINIAGVLGSFILGLGIELFFNYY